MPNFWLKNKYNTMHTLSKARKKSRLIFSCNINLVSFNFCNGLSGPDGPNGPSGADLITSVFLVFLVILVVL